MYVLYKPVLITCKEHECTLFTSHNGILQLYEGPHSFPALIRDHFKLHIIEIKQGNLQLHDWCIDITNNSLHLFQGSLPKYHYVPYRKIIATTSTLDLPKLPEEYIQQFIKEYNNDAVVDVLIEHERPTMVIDRVRENVEGHCPNCRSNATWTSGDTICFKCSHLKIKNGYVTAQIPTASIKTGAKMYSEEEVRELFIKRNAEFTTSKEPFRSLLLQQDLEWFEANKK